MNSMSYDYGTCKVCQLHRYSKSNKQAFIDAWVKLPPWIGERIPISIRFSRWSSRCQGCARVGRTHVVVLLGFLWKIGIKDER